MGADGGAAMSVIDNGKRVLLNIPGVFAGIAGMSRRRSHSRRRAGVGKLKAVYAATLDEKPAVLTNVQPAGDGRSYTAQVLG
jgi:hypothetical protein